jgi:hypothetical protein
MKAAITAVLSAAMLCGIAAPAFAQYTTIQSTTAAPVVTGPAVIAAPGCVNRQLTYGATYPGSLVQVVPMPAYANDYGCAKMDYAADFTWEAFGGESDLGPIGGGG